MTEHGAARELERSVDAPAARAYPAVMKLFQLVAALLLTAIAFDLVRALITHRGVGPVEWVVGLGLAVVLATRAAGVVRRSLHPS